MQQSPQDNYGLDFVFGIIHFFLFYALAISINYDGSGKPEDAISPYIFTALLGVILLYDAPWALVNWNNKNFDLIKMWVLLNILTVILFSLIFGGFCIYAAAKDIPLNYLQAEGYALFPVFIISAIDIGELITGKRPVEGAITWVANKLLSFVSKSKPDGSS